jgi:putative spermidine/putrescine transport system ATP-binding protein
MTAAVSLESVSCVFAGARGLAVRAVDEVSLMIQPGEFFTLLGPSGSGKTTCLRLIGGFQLPTAGRVFIDGADVTGRAPFQRPVNTVFQDYALFPHMSVAENVAYGLMVRGVDAATRRKRAQALLDLVRLPDVGERRPVQLSGGQRQRVALARALINEPKVLLLDEPLGALDLKLREQMQVELKRLQRQLGITFVFVTHDQHEALSMSDRIGIFERGRLAQVASPAELYTRPATRFVAEFVGSANVLHGAIAARHGGSGPAVDAIMIRPEAIRLVDDAARARLSGRVVDAQYFGSFWRVSVEADDDAAKADAGGAQGTPQRLIADMPTQALDRPPAPGGRVHLHWSDDAVHPIREQAGARA